MVMEGDLTSSGKHTIQYTAVELNTWNLYNFTNQCHLNKFNLKKKNAELKKIANLKRPHKYNCFMFIQGR